MKNTIYPLLALLLIFSAGCKTKDSSTKTLKKDFNIEAAYLLLPIQDESPEVKVSVTYPDSISESPYFIRLAQDSIDYWVKLDVKNYKGKTVSLEFEGLEKNSFALRISNNQIVSILNIRKNIVLPITSHPNMVG